MGEAEVETKAVEHRRVSSDLVERKAVELGWGGFLLMRMVS